MYHIKKHLSMYNDKYKQIFQINVKVNTLVYKLLFNLICTQWLKKVFFRMNFGTKLSPYLLTPKTNINQQKINFTVLKWRSKYLF